MCASERLGWLLLLLVCGTAAFAQQAPSREQELIRRLRQQVQQLQQAQAEQQQAAQKASGDLAAQQQRAAAVQADLGRARSAGAAQARELGELKTEREALAAERDALKLKLDEAHAEIERRANEGRQLRADLAQRQTLLGTREATFAGLWRRHQAQAQGLQACIASNDKLHGLGLELLDRYASKGPLQRIEEQEPFLQFGRVRLENLLQGYRDKLDQSALKPAAGDGS